MEVLSIYLPRLNSLELLSETVIYKHALHDEIIIQVGNKAEKLSTRQITILSNCPSPTLRFTEISFENGIDMVLSFKY